MEAGHSRTTPNIGSFGAFWRAALAGSTVAIIVIAIWWVIQDRAHKHIGLATENAANIDQLLIRHDVDHRVAALDRLAKRWAANEGTPRAIWEADALRYASDMPGFQAIEWVDSSSHVQWIVPYDGNEARQGLDITQAESERMALASARASGKAVLSQPFELGKGDLAVAVYIPVFRDARFNGAIVGILHLESWLSSIVGDVQNTDYHARITLQNKEIFRYDPDEGSIDRSRTERSEFTMYGLTWAVFITPTSTFLSAGHAESSLLVLIAGLLFSAVVAIVVYLVQVARVRSRQLRDTAGQLETLFQNLPGMAFRCMGLPNRPMEFVSDGCLKLSGYSHSEFVDQKISWGELIHRGDRGLVSRRLQEAVDNAKAYEIEYRIVTRSNQEKWVWERGRAVDLDGHENLRLEGFISDISRQRAAETEARQQREQMAHMDRLDMLGEMASGIAHEINQPLTAISLFAEAGQRLFKMGKQSQLPDIFEKLSRHAHRAGAVIERMQTMARRQERPREIVDCNVLVEEIAKLAEAEAKIRDMTIEIETGNNGLTVDVDTVQIQQVALNLLRNAMEAMQSVGCRYGNRVRLRTRLLEGGEVEVAVIDQGSGVTDAVSTMLFTPFSTTKESGMGMGLSISRAIVTAHGGQLNFRNNESNGATFFFTLPSAKEED